MLNLKSTDHFVNRHIGPDENQTAEMLKAIGVNSLEDLISETVPENIRRKEKMNLPDAPIEVRITDPAMAKPLRFLGSPTVLINGLDIEPGARDSDQFGFGCRTYFSEGRRSGLPTKELVLSAIRDALNTTP